MRAVDLIEKKRNGGELTPTELDALISGYTAGAVADYQMSAFAMAVYFRGMTPAETAALTDAMYRSGDRIDLSRFGALSVDKHSTGGVGDKTTLVVAPLVAALGGRVAKLSGRGLGHTGGTVDKLGSIPGFRVQLSEKEFLRQVEDIGVAVIGQTGDLVPADKKLYALRDVTATVDSLPLIASSVMSKKLAAGAASIVLDVKVGSGAFIKTREEGMALAELMADIGRRAGRRMCALVTNMDIPLGRAVGNTLEVTEAAAVLRGEYTGPLARLCTALAARMLTLCRGWSIDEAEHRVAEAISSGAAFRRMEEWVAAQGGDPAALTDSGLLPQPAYVAELRAERSGCLAGLDALKVGQTAALLGAGREKKEDAIDPAAGVLLLAETGDYVTAGQPIARLCTGKREALAGAEELFRSAVCWGEEPPEPRPLIFGTL